MSVAYILENFFIDRLMYSSVRRIVLIFRRADPPHLYIGPPPPPPPFPRAQESNGLSGQFRQPSFHQKNTINSSINLTCVVAVKTC